MDEREHTVGTASDITDLMDLTDNQFVKELLGSRVVKFFAKDPSSKIALATALITLGSFLVRTLDYMRLKGYLSVFSIPIEYVDYSANQSFSYFLFQAIVFIGFAIPISMSYLAIESLWFSHNMRKITYSIVKMKILCKIKNFITDTVKSIPLFVLIFLLNGMFNTLLCIFLAKPVFFTFSGIIEYVAVLIIFFLFELVVACLILFLHNYKLKMESRVKEKEKKKTAMEKQIEAAAKHIKIKRPAIIELALSSVFVLVFILSTTAYFMGIWDAHQQKSFSIVDGNYAIIYQCNDNYWTVAATESKNTLTLDTTHQKVIPISGCEIEKHEYDGIIINYHFDHQ